MADVSSTDYDTEAQKEVLSVLADDGGWMRTNEVYRSTDLKYKYVNNLLIILHERGVLSRRWDLNDPDNYEYSLGDDE
jgi:transcription initiation factor IIE alpha subunit